MSTFITCSINNNEPNIFSYLKNVRYIGASVFVPTRFGSVNHTLT